MNTTPTYSLSPVAGTLDRQQLLHLLRRTLIGVGADEFHFFEGKTVAECLEILLKPAPSVAPPVQEISDYPDPLIPLGETWVNAPYENDTIQSCREFFLKTWWMGNIVSRNYSLTEKMTLFWNNHFVTEAGIVKDARYSYRYADLLRKYALGNVNEFIREGSTNLAMLVYLNGNQSTGKSPNENYARELMELFTVGKGYAQNYTEEDVQEAARVFTGYTDDKEAIKTRFYPERHDSGDKKFSSFFDHHIIRGREGEAGREELDELIAMIFRKPETARFICRNVYRWFVSHYIDENVEQKIIVPLSDVFVKNNFEIRPVLQTLLSSEHFFSPMFRGCIVKSPVEFVLGALREFDAMRLSRMTENHEFWWGICLNTAQLGMHIADPPSVAGWAAYYQEPKFHRWWLNSASLGIRSKMIGDLCSPKGLFFNGPHVSLRFLPFAEKVEGKETVATFIKNSLVRLMAVNVGTEALEHFKKVLLAGLESEKEWENAWAHYAENSGDPQTVENIEKRLRAFYKSVMELPEYQMM